VNQLGEVQSVGGVNEKIEGFFATCKLQGLTGSQGVCIPATNVPDLCLDDDVVEACAAGTFHVWPIESVDDAVPRLMGHELGQPTGRGTYPEGSVLATVGAALDRYQDVVRVQSRR
jgi:predicted ATP-dependent protease